METKKTTEESKDLAKRENQLPALPDLKTLGEVYDANFGDGGIRPSFTTIKIPTGGGLAWTIPTETEEPDIKKELTGIIIDHFPCRAYWPDEFGGGNMPPTCTSLDAKSGSLARAEGAYGDCGTCKFARWGSGREGRGQACKKMHRVYLLMLGGESVLPYLVSLPPTSAPEKGGYEGSIPTYSTKMMGKMKKIFEIVTKIKLVNDESKGDKKFKFSKAQFFFLRDATTEEKVVAAFLRDKLRSAMREKDFDVGEYHTEEAAEHTENGSENKGKDPWDKG